MSGYSTAFNFSMRCSTITFTPQIKESPRLPLDRDCVAKIDCWDHMIHIHKLDLAMKITQTKSIVVLAILRVERCEVVLWLIHEAFSRVFKCVTAPLFTGSSCKIMK